MGRVRTAISRSRQAATTLPRRIPGADGDRDHDLVGRVAVEDRADLVGRPEHLQAHGPHVALRRVVVDEADRVGADVRVQLELADDHLAAGAGADDEHAGGPPLASRALRALGQRAAGEPGAAEQRAGEDEVEDHDRARQAVRVGLDRARTAAPGARWRRPGRETAARGRGGGSSATTGGAGRAARAPATCRARRRRPSRRAWSRSDRGSGRRRRGTGAGRRARRLRRRAARRRRTRAPAAGTRGPSGGASRASVRLT